MYDFSSFSRNELLKIGSFGTRMNQLSLCREAIGDPGFGEFTISIEASDFVIEHDGGRTTSTVEYRASADELRSLRAAINAALRANMKDKKKRR